MKTFHLHLVSDSTGETVGSVARAALAQFEDVDAEEHNWTLVRTKTQIDRVIANIDEFPGMVLYTLVDKQLGEMLKKACQKHGQPCIAVLAPVVNELSAYLGEETQAAPGKQHQMDEEYFSRVDAINYALSHDDSQGHWDLDGADIILCGPSRTSKSPTCVYLAYKGFKAANVPFVLGIDLPPGLFTAKDALIVGLTISPDRLQQIRKERLNSLKQEDTSYVDVEMIHKEIDESRKLFRQQGWPVIDVTRKSVEETAATILQYHQNLMKQREQKAEHS